jgi:hypothetical protein
MTVSPKPLYRAERLPTFQNRVFRSAQEARNCPTGDVVLVQDASTGLISNHAFRPELMEYGPDYHNEQSLSRAFQSHLRNVAEIIQKHFNGSSLIEVGCGKGYFLEILQSLDFTIAGLDPAYEGSNPAIIKRYFGTDAGLRGEGIILRHVLEHVQNPVTFLDQIRASNGGKGIIYIEVPCFDWICEHKAWFDVFYEHVNYFRLGDFGRMFGTVYESGHCFNGQYLYAVADLATLRSPSFHETDRFDFPAEFLEGVKKHANRLKELSCTPVVVWGAASKGVIFSLFMQRAGAPIHTVIDINPAKQGGFLPVTGLQVQSPAACLSHLAGNAQVYIMNSNYSQEIRALTQHRFHYVNVDHETL